jgi:transposase
MNLKKERRPKMESNKKTYYNQYLAIDWSIVDVEIARMSAQGAKIVTRRFVPDIKQIKEYLNSIKGKKIMTIEETTSSHWLYVELLDCVDRIIICDPYRNSLLGEGPKNDKIDARKLCLLLRSGLLKEVYHSLEEDYKIRKLVSAYEALVKAGVRVKNQKSAIYRAEGLRYKKDKINKQDEILSFIEQQQNASIKHYEQEKEKYENKFREIKKKNKIIKMLCGISGIGTISAVKIYSKVIDANRFENKYKYWGMCGLVYYQRESGGRNYGRKKPRYSRTLKSVYKTAAMAAIGGKNDIRDYYEVLLKQGYSISEARNQIARYIAKVSYGVMKNEIPYRAYQWRELKKVAA